MFENRECYVIRLSRERDTEEFPFSCIWETLQLSRSNTWFKSIMISKNVRSNT